MELIIEHMDIKQEGNFKDILIHWKIRKLELKF